jgi:hypothetical protein
MKVNASDTEMILADPQWSKLCKIKKEKREIEAREMGFGD